MATNSSLRLVIVVLVLVGMIEAVRPPPLQRHRLDAADRTFEFVHATFDACTASRILGMLSRA